MLTRRSILVGLLAAPIIVRPGLVMPVRAMPIRRHRVLSLRENEADFQRYWQDYIDREYPNDVNIVSFGYEFGGAQADVMLAI